MSLVFFSQLLLYVLALWAGGVLHAAYTLSSAWKLRCFFVFFFLLVWYLRVRRTEFTFPACIVF